MMRKLAMGFLLMLAACSEPAPPAPPANAIEPGTIDYFDITKNKLFGSGCNFVADGGGMGAILMALEADAVLKLDGKLVKIAADKTSKPLKQGSWTHYKDPAYTLTLTPVEDGKGKVNGVVEMLTAQMTLSDAAGKVLFTAKGQAQCKPM
jgi:hypothetical protein